MGQPEKRETWGSWMEFMLSCAGFCVGLGNIWRFCYLSFKNGGGAFLLPYLSCIVIIGYPISFLEVAVGQLTRQGAIGMWTICPLFTGIGYSSLMFAAYQSAYYNILLAWIGYYFVASFSSDLPWTHCHNSWNSENCTTIDSMEHPENNYHGNNVSGTILTATTWHPSANATLTAGQNAAQEFWWKGVLQLTEGIEVPGEVCSHLVASLAIAWVAIYLCTFNGIRWSGKVVYFTVIFPYVLLIILLVQAARQDGSGLGVAYYMRPQFDKLADSQVWFDAAAQVLFSYAVSLTVLPAFGSYCPFKSNCFRDTILIAIVNSSTSVLAGFVVYAMLGYMAHSLNLPIEDVATSGPGLAFVVYPQAVNLLPIPQLWSVFFFFTMILVGIDSQIGLVEGVVTGIFDIFPRWIKWRKLVLLVFTIGAFLLGIPMVTQGGMYVFHLLDSYVFGAYVMQIIAFLEVVGVCWGYGVDHFYDDIEAMIGFRLNPWMKICWLVLTPLSLLVLVVVDCFNYHPLTYNKTYIYPTWANALGFILCVLVVIVVPIYAAIKLLRTEGKTWRERLRNATRSQTDCRRNGEMAAGDIQTEENAVLEMLETA